MRTLQASEVKTHLLRILDDVERGESVVVTRHGKPVARITPERSSDNERVPRAREEMRAFRARVGRVSIQEILSAREEGRE